MNTLASVREVATTVSAQNDFNLHRNNVTAEKKPHHLRAPSLFQCNFHHLSLKRKQQRNESETDGVMNKRYCLFPKC